jgi:hypothetical protein
MKTLMRYTIIKMYFLKMFKIDYFIFKYFLTSKIAVLYKKMSNGSPLLNRVLFFPKNKLFSVMSNCSTNCELICTIDYDGGSVLLLESW